MKEEIDLCNHTDLALFFLLHCTAHCVIKTTVDKDYNSKISDMLEKDV